MPLCGLPSQNPRLTDWMADSRLNIVSWIMLTRKMDHKCLTTTRVRTGSLIVCTFTDSGTRVSPNKSYYTEQLNKREKKVVEWKIIKTQIEGGSSESVSLFRRRAIR